MLGEGGFGKVRMVQKRIDGMKYALKGCALERDEGLVDLHLREVKTMSKLSSSKVVRYFDSWIEDMTDDVVEGFFGGELKRIEMKNTKKDGTLVLFMQLELCDTDLKKWIKEPRTLAEKWDMTQQIAEGLHFIHSRGLVHRDMKPANVLINVDKRGQPHAKIADLGLAKFRRNRPLRSREASVFSQPETSQFHGEKRPNMTKMVGTMLYGAPEQMTSRDYNNKVDMYALGIILFEMFSQFSSRSERHAGVLKLRKRRKCYFRDAPDVADLIMQLLHRDPRMRPSAHDILISQELPFGKPNDLTPAQSAYMEREILKVSLGTNSRSRRGSQSKSRSES